MDTRFSRAAWSEDAGHCPAHCQPDCPGGRARIGWPQVTRHESLDGASWDGGLCPYCIGASRAETHTLGMYSGVRVPFWVVLEGVAAMIASTIPADNRDALNEAQRLWPRMDKWARLRIAREVETHRPVDGDRWHDLLHTPTSDSSYLVPVMVDPRASGDDGPRWPSVSVDRT